MVGRWIYTCNTHFLFIKSFDQPDLKVIKLLSIEYENSRTLYQINKNVDI